MKRKKYTWTRGDFFKIKLSDNSFYVGRFYRNRFAAVYDRHFKEDELHLINLQELQNTEIKCYETLTEDEVNSGELEVIGYLPVSDREESKCPSFFFQNEYFLDVCEIYNFDGTARLATAKDCIGLERRIFDGASYLRRELENDLAGIPNVRATERSVKLPDPNSSAPTLPPKFIMPDIDPQKYWPFELSEDEHEWPFCVTVAVDEPAFLAKYATLSAKYGYTVDIHGWQSLVTQLSKLISPYGLANTIFFSKPGLFRIRIISEENRWLLLETLHSLFGDSKTFEGWLKYLNKQKAKKERKAMEKNSSRQSESEQSIEPVSYFPFEVQEEMSEDAPFIILAQIEGPALYPKYAKLFEKYGYSGNGYCWESHIIQILEEEYPSLLEHIEFNSEAGLFQAEIEGKKHMWSFINVLGKIFSNMKTLEKYIRRADETRIDD